MAASLAIRHSLNEIPHLLTSETPSWGFRHSKLKVFILSSDYIFIWLKKTQKHCLGSVLQILYNLSFSTLNDNTFLLHQDVLQLHFTWFQGLPDPPAGIVGMGTISHTSGLGFCPCFEDQQRHTRRWEQRESYSRNDSVPGWWFFGQQEQDWYFFRHKCEKYNLLFWGTPTEQRWYHETQSCNFWDLGLLFEIVNIVLIKQFFLFSPKNFF